MKSYNELKEKIILCMMDRGQTAPVTPRGTRDQIVNSSIIRHYLWSIFFKTKFGTNLRILRLQDENDNNVNFYILYEKALMQIRTNGPFTHPLCEIWEDYKNGIKRIQYKGYKFFTKTEDAITFLYPNAFKDTNVQERAILCSKNTRCDYWNTIVQKLNEESMKFLFSANIFADVDNDKGFLNDLLNLDTLEYYKKPGIPYHELQLKVGDICFLMRSLSKKELLVHNIRVKILKISRFRIQVLVLVDTPNVVRVIPRIRFIVKHFSGYNIIRTQFPLLLSYAMTKNKAQGQTIPWCIIDVSDESFAHGQEYVAFSRPNVFNHSAIFCNESDVVDNEPTFINVVYDELMENDNYELLETNSNDELMDIEINS